MPSSFVTTQEIITQARRNLSQHVWHYLTGGAESETTMCRNRLALDSLAFRPRALVDGSKIKSDSQEEARSRTRPVMWAAFAVLWMFIASRLFRRRLREWTGAASA